MTIPSSTLLSRYPPLPRSFYERSTLTVARDLPGLLLVRRWRGALLTGRIVEVEAYLGSKDPASHAYRGMTDRNRVMFRGGGYLYVYFTYGMHFCCNVVTGPPGKGHAVLIRAVEPLGGIAAMVRRRGTPGAPVHHLCNGPGKLCHAFRIGRAQDGIDLCGDRIWLASDSVPLPRVSRSTRVGISSGRRHRWRFFVRDSPFVSPGRPVSPDGVSDPQS